MSNLFRADNNSLALVTLFCILALPGFAFASESQAPAKKGYPVVRYWLKGHLTEDFHLGKNKKGEMPALTLTKNSKTKIVHSCKEYLHYLDGWRPQKSAQNMRDFNIFQPCLAKHIFHQGVASSKSAFHTKFSSIIYKFTDLSNFSAYLDNQVNATKKTLMSTGLKDDVKSETSLILKPKYHIYRFDLLAKGDFTHDGNEDLLVRFVELPNKGSDYTLRFLVLTKNAHHNLWNAIEAADYIQSN